VDDHARAVGQATVHVAGFSLGEGRPENLDAVWERVSDNHLISPSQTTPPYLLSSGSGIAISLNRKSFGV
jgi:hypothetical protein